MSRRHLVVEQARRILGTYETAAEALGPMLASPVDLDSQPLSLASLGDVAVPAAAARGAGIAEVSPAGRLVAEQAARDIRNGLEAMKKVERGRADEVTDQDQAGLEAIILLAGRPAILIQDGDFLKPPKMWKDLENVRAEIKDAIRRVGRIEVSNHPDFEWLGTGFLAGPDTVVTNRHVAIEFSRQAPDGTWTFRAPRGASVNFLAELGSESDLTFTVTGIVGIHEQHDLGVLRVEQTSGENRLPDPLTVAAVPPATLVGSKVYVIGYPAWDGRRNDPEPMRRIFADIYNVKRLQPGEIAGEALQSEIFHDCSTLGGNSGSPVFDLETHRVVGLHFGGRFLEKNHAVPLWTLQNDDLIRRAGLNFQ